MPQEFRINGSLLDTDQGVEAASVFSQLRLQGWQLLTISVDGKVSSEKEANAAGIDSVIEIAASPPSTEPGEATAALRDEILASLENFQKHAEKLGEAFSRGEWEKSLSSLQLYLGDFEVLLHGIRAFSELKQIHRDLVQRVPGLLQQLQDSVNRKSWVEVSDLLLYELRPLIQEWQGLAETKPENQP